tara:strand:- start:425 stop:1192 length:768 start_codon:yes stop_codon:yes gene_type:complete
MTTLAANALRDYLLGNKNELPTIGSDIIYQGAAVGMVAATGLMRPLVAGDDFCGFAEAKADNASGAASAINVNLVKRGRIELLITGLVITDLGLPVFATDDNAFSLSPVGGSFVGFVDRFISSGVGIVEFDALNFRDPYAEYSVREVVSADKTLDPQDSGKLFWVDTDARTITLAAVATPTFCKIVNGGAYGTVAVTISPDADDSVEGPDISAANNKDVINTKATARRGDFAVLGFVDADGYAITQLKGIWAREG